MRMCWSANRRRSGQPKSMQATCSISNLYKMARVDDFLTDRDTLAVADLGNRKTHEANHNAQELAEILAGFRTARLRLVEHLGTFEPDVFARTSLHPRLKQPMRLVDHLYFVAEHDDHHLATISELIDTHFPKR